MVGRYAFEGEPEFNTHGDWVSFDDYEALRERAEAAENERDELRHYFKSAGASFDILVAERNAANAAETEYRRKNHSLAEALTQSRASEAAARVDGWNAGIEAAAQKCRENSMSSMAGEKAIRALALPAPTADGETT